MLYHNLELHNVAQIFPAEKGKGLRLARLPEKVRRNVHEGCARASLHAAGCELRFNLKPGDELKLTLELETTGYGWERGGLVEVFQGPFQVAWYYVGTKPTEFTVTLPASLKQLKAIGRRVPLLFDPALTRIVLPYRPALKLLSLEGTWAPPRPRQVPRKRLLIYGTSLTHGAWSLRPTETYAMRLARLLGMDLINLGFGGNCRYEPALAEHLAGRKDWDMAVFESHNLVAKITPEEFRERFRHFVRTVAGAHPRKPIFCTNLFMITDCMPDVAGGGVEHNALRAAARSVVKELSLPNVRWIPTRALFRDPAGLTSDLVHPSPAGMEEIAARLARRIRNGTRVARTASQSVIANR